MAITPPNFTLQAGYCMSGLYRGYLGDGDNSSGSTASQMTAIASVLGWTPEVVMVGGGINASLTGLQQHIVLHQPFWPINSGGSLNLGANSTTYQSYWRQTVDALNTYSLNNAQVTLAPCWEGQGSNGWGGLNGNNGIDPHTGVANTKADWIGTFRALVTYMRSYGLSSQVLIDWNVMNSTDTGTILETMYPGDDVVDIVGWDPYFRNHVGANNHPRTDAAGLYVTEVQKGLDVLYNFAVKHNKLAGLGECNQICAITGDTTSDVYTYGIVDNSVFWSSLNKSLAAYADRFVYICMFNQNQYYKGITTNSITEDNQVVYLGTDLATQTYPYLRSTNATGPAYLTTSPEKKLLMADYKKSMVPGTMKTAPPPITPTIPTYAIPSSTVLSNPRIITSIVG
jgi:hypothetical protein